MMKNLQSKIIIGVFLFLLVACVSPNNIVSTPTTLINPNDWLYKWLTSATCQPPCWENITPGETSFNTAVSIISSIPNVNIQGVFLTPSILYNTTTVSWDFEQNGSGSLSADYDNQIVKHIVLSPENNQILLIKNLIDSYGNPDSIITANCFGEYFSVSCPYVIIYRDLGMVGYLSESTNDKDPLIIYPDTQILFLILSSKDDIRIFDNPNAKIYEVIWDGYKAYKFERDN